LFITGIMFAGDMASSKETTPTPLLAGEWTLDTERSELPPPSRLIDDESPPWDDGSPPMGHPGGGGFGPGRGMGRRGGGMGGPMRGGFGRPRPSREEIEAMRTVMRSALNPPTSMRIVQSDTELTISHEDGYRLVLFLDGRKRKSENGVERKARWRKNRLEEEIKVAMSKIKRTYAVIETDSGKDLVITVRVERSRFGKTKDFKFVYVPATTMPDEPTLGKLDDPRDVLSSRSHRVSLVADGLP
jgi:hypothetical protein